MVGAGGSADRRVVKVEHGGDKVRGGASGWRRKRLRKGGEPWEGRGRSRVVARAWGGEAEPWRVASSGERGEEARVWYGFR